MPLSAGDKLGPYEILALIGAGGMGEVYRARDPRLGRDVAVKVSAQQFTERFEREARAVAALNHPNICTLYDVGPNYLVMEYIEGEAPKGPMPLEEALRIAAQIRDALDAAHEKGIIHRDLKPANIKIKPDGTVKVLDFGLAKVTPASAGDSDAANSPTLTIGATQAGMIVGTAAYMSPEQARAKTVDKRADIWAFGVVLHEILTGQQMFAGEDGGHTLAAVIMKEPDLSAVPPSVRRLLERCLEKDPKKRLRDIGDAWQLLDVGQAHGLSPTGHGPVPQPWPWITTAALTLIAAALAFIHLREQPPPAPQPVVFQISPPDKSAINGVSVSPDGRMVAFTARNPDGRTLLWVRSLVAPEARPLGVEVSGTTLFWSPDQNFIGFGAPGNPAKLKKIEVTGGSPQTICDLPGTPRGAAWSPAGIIVFGTVRGGLMQVSANGGTPSPLTLFDRSGFTDFHGNPTFLPDGRHFLYQRASGIAERQGIFLGSLDTKPEQQSSHRLVATENAAVYARASGQLVFEREGALMAQRFDSGRLELTGEASRVADNIPSGAPPLYSASANGVLAYETGAASAANSRLVWYDRQGKALGQVGPPGSYSVGLLLSPDGKRVIVEKRANGAQHVWTADVSRGVFSRLNAGETVESIGPISADGRVAFSSTMNGAVGDIYASFVNGVGPPELWAKSNLVMHPNAFSPDGRFLIYDVHDPERRQDLWILPTSGDRKPIPFLTTPADETFGQFSPDGKWIAYDSDESGRREVYVQGFAPDRVPAAAVGKWLISSAGGNKPRWRHDGKELFYLALDGKMMAVPVKSAATFEPGVAIPLFEAHVVGFVAYDVSPDGRFLINTPVESDAPSTPITVVLSWQAGLKK